MSVTQNEQVWLFLPKQKYRVGLRPFEQFQFELSLKSEASGGFYAVKKITKREQFAHHRGWIYSGSISQQKTVADVAQARKRPPVGDCFWKEWMGHEYVWLGGVYGPRSKFTIHGRIKGVRMYQCWLCIPYHLHFTCYWKFGVCYQLIIQKHQECACVGRPPVAVPVTICFSGWATSTRLPLERRMRLF